MQHNIVHYGQRNIVQCWTLTLAVTCTVHIAMVLHGYECVGQLPLETMHF